MRESPIGEDDNEEVRQRQTPTLILYFPLNKTFPAPIPNCNIESSKVMIRTRTMRTRAQVGNTPPPVDSAAESTIEPLPAARKRKRDETDVGQRSVNDDFCSACNGIGYLLCCDGCEKSFHFTCLDPPLNREAKELDEPWYCFICVANRPLSLDSPEKGQAHRGMFSALLGSLKKRNPRNFELPQEVREYFEGVGTDKNGAFVEALNSKPARYATNSYSSVNPANTGLRNRPGYGEEQMDYTKLRDGKGVLVTCFGCRLSSQNSEGPKRAIVCCDFCGQHWHLDCLDPPLANPPALNQNGKKVHDWMCPLHADHELRNVPMSQLNRSIHIRKPKSAKLLETALSRGHRNNGIIEIEDDETDASDSEFYDVDGERGTVYKLPVKGIKLDFIDKVKKYVLLHHLFDAIADCSLALVRRRFATFMRTTSVFVSLRHRNTRSPKPTKHRHSCLTEPTLQIARSRSSRWHSNLHSSPTKTQTWTLVPTESRTWLVL